MKESIKVRCLAVKSKLPAAKIGDMTIVNF